MTPQELPLTGRVAVVTGASGGIGEATARRLAADGARVALLGRRKDELERVAAEIGGLAVVADVTAGPEHLGSVADQVRDELGRPDLVVANAGLMLAAPFATADRSEWTGMLDTNVTGLIDTARAFVDDLLAAPGPADLVLVGSIAASNHFPTYAVYSATKAAVAALARGLRLELGPRGVRVRTVEPGLTRSDLGSGMLDPAGREGLAQFRENLESIPAADVADAIAWAGSLPARVNVAELVVLPTAQG